MTDQPSDRTGVDEAAEADSDAVTGGLGRDGGPENADDMAAADGLRADRDVAAEYSDMLERGAHQRGEGRVP